VRAQLNTDPSANNTFGSNGEPCDQLCPLGDLGPPGGSPEQGDWALAAAVQGMWQFTDPAGHIVETAHMTMTSQGGPSGSPLMVPVAARWDGAWSATMPDQEFMVSGLCEAGMARFMSMASALALGWAILSSATPCRTISDGCLVTATKAGVAIDPGTPPVLPVTRAALYRFGALVAADPATHQQWPQQLPLPSAHERSIIATLAHLTQ
jgi:hypothetical protein